MLEIDNADSLVHERVMRIVNMTSDRNGIVNKIRTAPSCIHELIKEIQNINSYMPETIK